MPLDPNSVGATGEPRTISWDSTDALLYAVGIGAGADDLAFTTENTQGITQLVYPTFAVVPAAPSPSGASSRIGTYDRTNVVHASQSVTVHAPIPVEATASLNDRVAAIYDKGTAAIVVTESDVTTTSGDPLWSARSSIFIRGEGGWGGERGPSGRQHQPPADSEPDHVVTLQTSPEQALIYRLTGDRHRLHSDTTFAVAAGFDRPVLHGLCTYASPAGLSCGRCATTIRHGSITSAVDSSLRSFRGMPSPCGRGGSATAAPCSPRQSAIAS